MFLLALLLGFFLSDPINSRAEETVEIVTKEDAQSKAEFYLKGISKNLIQNGKRQI